MESRTALFVALAVGFASLHDCVPVVEDGSDLDGFSGGARQGDALLQEGTRDELPGAPATVTVESAPNPANPPKPTIKTLMPKHEKKQMEAYQAKNGGKMPDAKGKQDVHRLAMISAAKEINDKEAAEKELEEAAKKVRKLRKKIMRDKHNIKIVEKNENYAAKKAFQAEDRKVKFIAVKSKARSEVAAEQLKKIKKDAAQKTRSMIDINQIDEATLAAKKRYVEANDKLKVADQRQYKAKTILAKSKATANNARNRVQRKKQFLDNAESYKAKARLEYRTAKIVASYEKQHAKTIRVKLAALTAKKDAVLKFVKSLNARSTRDFAAAKASIEKAKDDFAAASLKFNQHTAKAKLYQKKYDKAVKLAEESRMGVVEALDAKEQNQGTRDEAITSSRNYNNLKKAELRDKEKLDKENIAAKAQHELIKVAQADLLQAQALQTKASKQKELVVQKKITMKAQLEKIDYLKAQVKSHVRKGKVASMRARKALHKVKNMVKDAKHSEKQAEAQLLYVKNIDEPIARKDLKNANSEVDTAKKFEDDERNQIKELDQERVVEDGRVKAIKRRSRKDAMQLKVKVMKAKDFKTRLDKASAKRDAVLTANTAKLKILNGRLDAAEANFKKADEEAEAAKEEARRAARAGAGEELGDAEVTSDGVASLHH